MNEVRYPRDSAHLVRDALISAFPWITAHIDVSPAPDDFTTELRIEIPAVHPEVKEPLVIETAHHPEGKWPPQIDMNWSLWNEDPLLTAPPAVTEHLPAVIASLRRFLAEESAGYMAWFEGTLTSGGTVAPPHTEPFPVGKADKIIVRSWRGTYDRELTGHWPGWPNDPSDSFYKRL